MKRWTYITLPLLIALLAARFPMLAQTRGTSTSSANFSSGPFTSTSMAAWNVAAGGTIIGAVRWGGGGTITVTDTGSVNSFSIGTPVPAIAGTLLVMFRAESTTAVSGDVLTVHFTQAGGVSFTSSVAKQYSGTASTAFDATASQSLGTAGNSITSGAFTTTQGPEMVVACATFGGSATAGTITSTPSTAMSLSVTDSVNSIQCEDANVYQIQTGVTASMTTTSVSLAGMVVGTLKSSNPTSPPGMSKAFSGATGIVAGVPYIYAGASATVTFSISNPNTSLSLSGISFSDTLPTNMVVAAPNGVSGACGGTVTATAASSVISLSGGALAGSGNCTISVNVTSTGAGPGVNTTGQITSTTSGAGIGPTATATLLMLGTPSVTISNIVVKAISHTSVNITYSGSGSGQTCQLQYGTSSGNYPYGGGSSALYVDGAGVPWCAISITGLAPSTTFYVMPTLRPTANTYTGLCQIGGSCGSSEQIFTTLALPAIHPAPPTPPTVWTPVEPNVSGYTVITMRANGSTGNCESASTVAAQTHWGAGVNAGDSFQTVINNIWFDVVIEFPEGLSCNIPASGPFNAGISLPAYSPNGVSADWVMIRTHPNAASDFPPFGVRTGPQYAAKLATLVAQTPGEPLMPGLSQQNFNGQILNCGTGCNHFWVENVAMTHAYNTTLYPPGIVDPPPFVNYVQFVSGDCSFNPNTGCAITNPALTPDHMVIDRVYAFEQAWPSRTMGCFYPGGTNWALVNNYCTTDFWIPAVYPQGDPTSAGTVITVPYSYFDFNQFDNAPIGMTTAAGYLGTSTSTVPIATGSQTFATQAGLSWVPGQAVEVQSVPASGSAQNNDLRFFMVGTVTSYSGTTLVINVTQISGSATLSNWIIVQPAVVTFSGAGSYSGTVIAWIGPTGLTIDYQTSGGVSAACTNSPGCVTSSTFSSPPTYLRSLVPTNCLYLFYGTFSSGVFSLGGSTADNVNPSLFEPWRPLGIYIQASQFGVYDNNYIQAIGQTMYNDTLGTTFADWSFTHNYFYFPRTKMQADPFWDGYGYSFRNVIETKQLARGQYIGNIIDGSASFQNPGNPLYVAGSFAGSYSTGTQDIMMSSNVAKHISAGFQMAGSGTSPGPPDAPPPGRIWLVNNLWLDLNRDIYNNGGGGLVSGSFGTYPMAYDVVFQNNTVGLTKGPGPELLIFGASSGLQSSTFGEGLSYTNNLALVSLNTLDVIMSSPGGPNSTYSLFPTNPTVYPSSSGPTPAGQWLAALNADFVHIGASITSSWQLGGNIVLPAQTERGLSSWTDLTPSQANSFIQTLWPSPDTSTLFPGSSADPWAATRCVGSGATLANRLTCIGWSATLNLANGNPNNYPVVPTVYNPTTIGANVTTVNQATGVVTGISTSTAATALSFTYMAPDARACSVDTSPTGAGTWTRMTDAGGAYTRSLTFTSLTASTAYDYRIQCYFNQSATYEFQPGQITSGTISTAASATRSVYTTFTLPATATKAVVSFQGLTGSPAAATCTASPCLVTAVPVGIDTRTLTYQTSGSVTVGTPSVVSVTIN